MERIDANVQSFWYFQGQWEYSDHKFLMGSPFPVAVTLVLYLWFVLKFGPQLMNKRPAFNLEKVLLVYNAVQVLISCYIFNLGFQFLLKHGLWYSECLCERDDAKTLIIDGSHYYFLAKLVELMDTVFFVLRKRQRQVSFLHVYHHTIMVICTWTIVKYSKTDSTIFLGVINSFVHIVMYGYYGLSVFPSLTKFLWWKKYITMMQLVQFTLMFVHVTVSHAITECRPAYTLLFTVWSNTLLFMYLFGDFYVKSYIKQYKAKDIVSADKMITSKYTKDGLNYIMNHHKLAGKVH